MNENTQTGELSVMSFNLRFGLADDGIHSWQHRQKAYPDFFNTYTPDFIGFQEANNFQSLFLENLLQDYSYIGMRDPSPERWQNNLIFYKKSWKCLQTKHYFLSETPEAESKLPESEWPRQCVIGLFENDGRQLIHVNTHFDFKESVQKRSAELIIDFLSAFSHDIPVVITGDFNADPYGPSYHVFLEKNFQDAFESNHSSTFHGFTGEDKGGHIDWILYRGAVSRQTSTVIQDRFSGEYPTDHYPVLAEFMLS